MELFGVGIPEIGLILLIALVIVGPQRFPEVARQVAHWIRTARAFTDEVMKDVRAAVDEIEQEVTASNDGVNPIREFEELRRELSGAAQEATSTVSEAAHPAMFEAFEAPSAPEPASTASTTSTADSTGAGAPITGEQRVGEVGVGEVAAEERRAGS